MKNTESIYCLAKKLEQKLLNQDIFNKEEDSNTDPSLEVTNDIKNILYKINLPMIELHSVIESLVKDSGNRLEENDLAIELFKFCKLYANLFKKFK
jgi:hypothetical protein